MSDYDILQVIVTQAATERVKTRNGKAWSCLFGGWQIVVCCHILYVVRKRSGFLVSIYERVCTGREGGE